MHSIEQVPEFRTLVLGVPLTEVVTMGEEAFLRTGLFLVSSGATDAGIKLVFFDGVDEGRRLEAVAARVGASFFLHFAGIDGRLNAADDEAGAKVVDEVVTELNRLGEVVSRVDVDKRHGDAAWGKGFGCKVSHHNAVLSS